MQNTVSLLDAIDRQKREISELKERSIFYTFDYIRNSEKPCWFKDAEQKMIVISKGYSRLFGISQDDYSGKTDEELHNAYGAEYSEVDRIIYQNKSFIRTSETWERNGVVYTGEVRKVYDFLIMLDRRIAGTYGEIEINSEDVKSVSTSDR
ncbi:MAG: hypothetical protein ACRBEE_13355 [Arenicella sp.]